jgi:hypothetical protein
MLRGPLYLLTTQKALATGFLYNLELKAELQSLVCQLLMGTR